MLVVIVQKLFSRNSQRRPSKMANEPHKRKQPVIDLTTDSDDEGATASTSRIPPPQTSKEGRSRKRTRAGERSKSASSRNSTPSTRSSSVVSTHNHKGKSKPAFDEPAPVPHEDIDGLPVLNDLSCPICFDLVTNACTTACVGAVLS